jgi:transposase
MCPGWYRDRQGTWHEQSLLDKHGEMRPMKSLLEERGLYQPDMDKAAMAAVLAAQHDFIEQRTLVEELLVDLGHGCLFLPKCHCEMNPIELVWSAAKRYCRKHCKYSLKALRATIPEALASVSLDSIRAFFERADAWAHTYRSGKDFVEARAAVKEQAKARRNARAKVKAAGVEAQNAASKEESDEDSSSAEDSDSESEGDVASSSEPDEDESSDQESPDEENDDDDVAVEPKKSDADSADRHKQPQAAPQAQPESKPRAAGRGVVGPSQAISRRSCCLLMPCCRCLVDSRTSTISATLSPRFSCCSPCRCFSELCYNWLPTRLSWPLPLRLCEHWLSSRLL